MKQKIKDLDKKLKKAKVETSPKHKIPPVTRTAEGTIEESVEEQAP